MKTIYTIEDFIKELGLSRATLWRMRKSGVIPKPDIDVGHPRIEEIFVNSRFQQKGLKWNLK